MLGRDSALPTITRNTSGNSGNFLGDPQLEKDLPQLFSKIRESHLLRIVEMGPESSDKNLGSRRDVTRKPQDSSKVVPCFQRGADLTDHTGGTYSHDGVIDYPRFPISEMHLGTFPHSMEFQSWKVNFKTEVCSKKNRFSWLRYAWCNDCVCIEWRSFSTGMCISEKEQASKSSVLKNTTDSHEGDKLPKWSTSIFEQLELMKQCRDCQIYSTYACRTTMSRISMFDGTTHCYQQVKLQLKWSWKNYTSQNCRMLFSFRLCWPCTTKKLYETKGNRAIQRLKASVR